MSRRKSCFLNKFVHFLDPFWTVSSFWSHFGLNLGSFWEMVGSSTAHGVQRAPKTPSRAPKLTKAGPSRPPKIVKIIIFWKEEIRKSVWRWIFKFGKKYISHWHLNIAFPARKRSLEAQKRIYMVGKIFWSFFGHLRSTLIFTVSYW